MNSLPRPCKESLIRQQSGYVYKTVSLPLSTPWQYIGGNRGIGPLILNLGTRSRCGPLHDPVALHPGKKPSTHRIWEWVGLTAEIYNSGRKKIFCPCWDSNTRLSTPFLAAIWKIHNTYTTIKNWREENFQYTVT